MTEREFYRVVVVEDDGGETRLGRDLVHKNHEEEQRLRKRALGRARRDPRRTRVYSSSGGVIEPERDLVWDSAVNE